MASLLKTSSSSQTTAVGIASAQFGSAILAGYRYRLTTSTAAWVCFGSNPTAAANTANNHYLAAGATLDLVCDASATKVAIIRDSADGFASLSLAMDGAQ